jgi:hypothetical protein
MLYANSKFTEPDGFFICADFIHFSDTYQKKQIVAMYVHANRMKYSNLKLTA